MMRTITGITRIFVGLLFIISGLIKLNDPVGFSFKLDEYFSAEVLNLPFLEPYALLLAVSVVIFEVMLGVMIISRPQAEADRPGSQAFTPKIASEGMGIRLIGRRKWARKAGEKDGRQSPRRDRRRL